DVIAALSGLNSYKLKFTLASQGATSGLAGMGNVGMEGTVIAKPSPASDLRMTLGGIPVPGASAPASGTALQVRLVQINGKTYMDLGSGKLIESTSEQLSSMAESLDPQKLLANVSGSLSQMQPVGDEQKDGVAITHYKADPQLLAAASAGLAKLGLADATWNLDVWVAKDGGYPVAWVMQGTGSNGSQMSITLDISDVNSPSNVVQGP
ncbi:MAG TPA: LppX_LprAFG lipoprotein, partial [Candidatus Limnocylindrales bacterium]